MLQNLRTRTRSALLVLGLLGLAGAATAATVLTKAQLDIGFVSLFESSLDQQNAQYTVRYSFSDTLTDGNAVDLAQAVFYDERTVNSSSTDVIDLAYDGAGDLTDAFGNQLIFTKVKVFVLENRSTTVGAILRIESDGTNGALGMIKAKGDGVQVGPGGVYVWWVPSAAAAAVTAGTGDLINIVNESGSANVTYRLKIIGTDT